VFEARLFRLNKGYDGGVITSTDGGDFVARLHDVHENLVCANSKYKQDADHKRRYVDFEEGEFVWAVLTKDHFLVGEYNKLSAKKIGPLEIHLIPYHGDSSDDGLAMNSRTNFVYPGGMMEAQVYEARLIRLNKGYDGGVITSTSGRKGGVGKKVMASIQLRTCKMGGSFRLGKSSKWSI
ncbi:hypothetical protein Tco_0195237, partial [Tanacetum coccineum]